MIKSRFVIDLVISYAYADSTMSSDLDWHETDIVEEVPKHIEATETQT